MENKNNLRNCYILIIAVGLLIYLPTLFFKFTYLDDNVLILDNYRFLERLSNIFQAFKQQVFHIQNSPAFYYRPMLTVSFMFDAQLGHQAPFIYHFTNLLIHLLASCLIFLFFIKLKFRKELALFFSLIFAAHPVLSQAVAWIPGRNDSLVMVFVLSAFILFIKFLEQKKWKYFFWHILFFALALFTKESVLLLPALIILYFYTISKESLPKKHKWKIIFAWVLVLIVWILLRQAALSEGSMKQTSIFEMMRSIIINLPGTIQYIGKIIFPVNLSVLPIVKDTTFIYGIVAIILLIIALIFSKNKRYNFIIFGASWFLLFLLPSLIRPDTAIAADFIEHRLYLPIAGFLLILMEIDWIKNLAENKKRLIIVGGLILIILSVITLIHSSNFRNRMNFWQNAIKTSPHSPLAHRNMGAMYHLDGFLDKAEREYIEALKLNPAEQMVHNNLGLIYMNQGDFTKAEGEFLKEIEINPYYDNVYFNFGLLRYKQGRIDDAAILWQKTIELNSNYLDAYSALKAIGR